MIRRRDLIIGAGAQTGIHLKFSRDRSGQGIGSCWGKNGNAEGRRIGVQRRRNRHAAQIEQVDEVGVCAEA